MTPESPDNTIGWSEETSRMFIDFGRYFVPERDRQIRSIACILSYLEGPSRILELCCGEGLLAEALLESFPEFTVHGLDGSAHMLEQARERLFRFESRFGCGTFDLAASDWRRRGAPIHAVISSLAIHHLTGPQKQELFSDVYEMLADNGSFVIADIVEPSTAAARRLAGVVWDEGVRSKSMELDGNTQAFEFFTREEWNTFWYPDSEGIDKPSPLFDQLKWLEQAGFVDVDVHWMLAGHAVFSGRKREDQQSS